jgi:hypothetical protein
MIARKRANVLSPNLGGQPVERHAAYGSRQSVGRNTVNWMRLIRPYIGVCGSGRCLVRLFLNLARDKFFKKAGEGS